jgi:hypothetical protein
MRGGRSSSRHEQLSFGEVTVVLDILYLALGIGGFALCLGSVFLCDRL